MTAISSNTDLHIRHIHKSFGSKAVLRDLDVSIKSGEFVSLAICGGYHKGITVPLA